MSTQPDEGHEREILMAALELPESQHEDFLRQACGGDERLKGRISKMIQVARLDGSFMAKPIFEMSQTTGERGIESTEKIIGPYKLLQIIGEGGMGTVYMAEQKVPVERRVALKIIRVGMDTKQVVARFEAERQALAIMDHPNIARVLDAGTTNSRLPYFVMELVRGIPITKYCDEKKLSLRERVELMIPVCHAIQHAHQKGIIHRDIKPSNVLVAQYDGRPVPKVIDFGIAKATAQRLTEKTMFTEFGQVIGTIEYMSPEQAEHNQLDIDTRSDVYSLGVLLYELLTGATPLDGKKLRSAAFGEMLRMIREDEPPRPSHRLSTIDTLASVAANRQQEPKKLSGLIRGELDWIVMMALEKDRNRRYESANGMAMDIQRYLLDEPVLACPPSSGYRLGKFARRNKVLLCTGALVATSMTAGLIGTTWQTFRATRAESTANLERDKKETALKAALDSAELERQARNSEVAARESESQQRRKAELAEADAREQERIAKKQLAISNAVTEFLQNDILNQAGSHAQSERKYKPDPDITIRKALDRAAKSVGEQFEDNPELEASIRFTIGNSYLDLGLYSVAIDQLKQSAEIRESILGREHLETLSSYFHLAEAYLAGGEMTDALELLESVREAHIRIQGPTHSNSFTAIRGLANAYLVLGKTSEATKMLEQLRDSESQLFGSDAPETLSTLSLLATAYRSGGRFNDAITLLEHVRDVRTENDGPDHVDTLATLSSLAVLYQDAGKTAKAIAMLERVRNVSMLALGPEHPDTLTTLANLAMAYQDNGRVHEAIEIHEKVREAEARILGPEHPDALTTIANLAELYQDVGKNSEAIKMIELVRDIETKSLGPEHPNTLTTLNNLAVAYERVGRSSEATAMLEQVRDTHLRVLGPDHPDTLASLANLAGVYDSTGRMSESIGIYELVRDAQIRDLGSEHPETLRTLSNLAVAFWRSKQLDKSLPLFEDVLKRREAALGRRHPDTLLTAGNLGVNYRDAGRLNEAIPLLEEAYKASRRNPKLRVVIPELFDCYIRAGKSTEAINLAKGAVGEGRKLFEPESLELASELVQGGDRLQKLTAWAESEHMLREGLSIRKTLMADDWRTFNTISMLGGSLTAQQKFAEAEPLLIAGYEGMILRADQIPVDATERIPDALKRLIKLYTEWQKPQQASEWQKKLEQRTEPA